MSVMMKNVYDDDLTGCSESRTFGAQSVLNTSNAAAHTGVRGLEFSSVV